MIDYFYNDIMDKVNIMSNFVLAHPIIIILVFAHFVISFYNFFDLELNDTYSTKLINVGLYALMIVGAALSTVIGIGAIFVTILIEGDWIFWFI